jgi:hypothetical protein
VGKIQLVFVLILSTCAFAFADDQPTPGKTGDFKVHFTQRNPLSSVKELSTRLIQKTLALDYDLSAEEFNVHVPANYDPQKPMGLIVLINYKDTGVLPTPVLPLMDERNIAFISEKTSHEPWWIRCGKALDEVYNMQQLYKIDPTRTYIFSFTNNDDCGLRLITSYSDVFGGALLCQEEDIWVPLRAANGGTYSGNIPHPPNKYLAAAKNLPIELVSQTPDHEHFQLAGKAFKAEGFRKFKPAAINVEDYHYPNYKVPWLTEVLTFLDDNAAKPKAPTTKPAS